MNFDTIESVERSESRALLNDIQLAFNVVFISRSAFLLHVYLLFYQFINLYISITYCLFFHRSLVPGLVCPYPVSTPYVIFHLPQISPVTKHAGLPKTERQAIGAPIQFEK